jgi:hypothetical protein
MEFHLLVERLSRNASVIQGLCDVPASQAGWKPTPDRWSVLEVINHLWDEEREDFRRRIEVAILHPERPYPPISPMEWVTGRRYAERNLAESLAGFLSERERSVGFLESLPSPDWDASGADARGGRAGLKAGDFLVSWVAHDAFHIRQLSMLHWDHTAVIGKPYTTSYAGDLTDLG